MDWNNDGHIDILSGCYWTEKAEGGHIQILAGNGSLDFAEAEELKNAAGDPLLNAKLSNEKNNGMVSNQTDTICTHQHAVDYDGDGDLDLVVGCFGSGYFYYENTGSNEEKLLTETPVKLSVESISHHSAPHLVDWDGDGDLDLISGTADGGAIYSENTGTREAPEWSSFRQLIAPSTKREQSTAGGQGVEPGPSTRLWATDWNGDGLLDLLVGDSVSIVNPKEGIEPADFEARQAEFEAKMEELQEKQAATYEQYNLVIQAGEEPDAKMRKKLQKASSAMMEVYNSREEFQDSSSTGFVWLFVQQPAVEQTLTSNKIAR